MSVVNLPGGNLRLDFTVTDGINTLSDCLIFTAQEYEAQTIESIEDLKQERFAQWVAFIDFGGTVTSTNGTFTPTVSTPLYINR
jgi:hypothetical protein